MWGHSKKVPSLSQNEGPHWSATVFGPCRHLNLGLSIWETILPEPWEINFCCLSETQHVVFCYSSPNRLRHAVFHPQPLPPPRAAAAKPLQSCPTLCNPRDGSPPGSPIPVVLQARTLEWVALSFSNAWKWKVKVKSLSRVWLLATPWTAAYQAPPSMGFSRQEYWSPLIRGQAISSLHFSVSPAMNWRQRCLNGNLVQRPWNDAWGTVVQLPSDRHL